MRHSFLVLLFFGASIHSLSAQVFHNRVFASSYFGGENDWVGDDYQNTFDYNIHWTQQIGVALAPRWYAGLRTRMTLTHKADREQQRFYMAGAFARWYALHPAQRQRRWGVSMDIALLNSNLRVEHDDPDIYLRRPGQWYIACGGTLEYRFWKGLCLLGNLEITPNLNGNYDTNALAILSIGFAWYPSRY
jgi:hypothetical protein